MAEGWHPANSSAQRRDLTGLVSGLPSGSGHHGFSQHLLSILASFCSTIWNDLDLRHKWLQRDPFDNATLGFAGRLTPRWRCLGQPARPQT